MMGQGFAASIQDALMAAFIVGILLAMMIVSIPAFFIGRYYGKAAVYEEARQRGYYDVSYDQKTGERRQETQ